MIDLSCTVIGMDKALDKAKALAKFKTPTGMATTIGREIARTMLPYAQGLTPVDTGTLQGSEEIINESAGTDSYTAEVSTTERDNPKYKTPTSKYAERQERIRNYMGQTLEEGQAAAEGIAAAMVADLLGGLI